MRTLSGTLEAGQKAASFIPYCEAPVVNSIAGKPRYDWTRFYTGAEPDDFHDCCMPADGSLIRIRKDASDNVQYSRVTSPDSDSTYSSWTDIGDNCGAVACCASGVNVWLFYLNTSDNKLYRKDSTDSGATFGSWVDMGDIGADSTFRLATSAKSLTEAIVIYSDGYDIYRSRLSAGAWEAFGVWTNDLDSISGIAVHYYSDWNIVVTGEQPEDVAWANPTSYLDSGAGWNDEANMADDNTATYGASDSVLQDAWTETIELIRAALDCNKIRFYAYGDANWIVDVDVWDDDDSAWVNALPTGAGGTAYSSLAWNTVTLDKQRSITKIRIKFYNSSAPRAVWLHEVDFGQSILRDGVWTTLLGAGGSQSADTWDSLFELTTTSNNSDISFKFPSLQLPGVFVFFFVEAYAANETYSRPYFTHNLTTASFNDNLWREPIPFNLSSDYGVALTKDATYFWMTRPDGVWRATLTPAAKTLTSDIMLLSAETQESLGIISIVLNNATGAYNTLGSGANEAITLGAEIRFAPGITTAEGDEISQSTQTIRPGPFYWVIGWEYVSRGGVAEFVLYGLDGWGLLEQWVARRQFYWDAGDSTIESLLQFVFARAGLELTTVSSSSTLTTLKPAFTISPGENGRGVVKRLLQMVTDVIYFRGEFARIIDPQSSDSSDYTYHMPGSDTNHRIFEGRYGKFVKYTNRTQVFGDNVFTEDFDWTELDLVYDRIAQHQDINLDTVAEATAEGAAMLRDADIHKLKGYVIVPMNCGQELYDVITITDSRAGLSAVKRRVIGLRHTWNTKKSEYSLRAVLGDV